MPTNALNSAVTSIGGRADYPDLCAGRGYAVTFRLGGYFDRPGRFSRRAAELRFGPSVTARRVTLRELRLHPAKTRIVYCKDGGRCGSYEHTSFTFLGFTFRARAARGKNGKKFTSFLPAVSKDARAKMSAEVRRWRLHLRTWHTMGSLAREINPVIRLDAVLRGVLPLGAAAPPAAHQRLPDALAPQEIQAAGIQEESPSLLRTRHEPTTPAVRHWAWVPYS